jgi:hypothetical protein
MTSRADDVDGMLRLLTRDRWIHRKNLLRLDALPLRLILQEGRGECLADDRHPVTLESTT